MGVQVYLPPHLVEKILVKLPVKSLKRFESVCNWWRLEFSDSKFIRTHLIESATSTKNSHTDLFFCDNYFEVIYTIRIENDFDDDEGFPIRREAVEVECPNLEHPDDVILSLVHCDGLLCIYTRQWETNEGDKVIVWNPSTKKHKKYPLPFPTFGSLRGFGFGYDSVMDDYKVVYIRGNEFQLQSLSLKTGLWKAVRNEIQYSFDINMIRGESVKSCVYWIAKKQDDDFVIVSFDLEKEGMKEETSLCCDYILNEGNHHLTLGLSKGSLCLERRLDGYSEVWLMEDNAETKRKSWNKFIKIPNMLSPSMNGEAEFICFAGDDLFFVMRLLIELDGADQRRDVLVIGATNRSEVMDPALPRTGRFGKLLYVPLPSAEERGLILKALGRKKPVNASVDLSAIGRMESCENLSGADLAALTNEAEKAALEEKLISRGRYSDKTPWTIKTSHFERALAKISTSVSDKYYQVLAESFKAA